MRLVCCFETEKGEATASWDGDHCRSQGKQAVENKGGFQVAKIATWSDDGVLPEFVGKNDIAQREQDALSPAGHLAELKQAYEDKFPWLKHGMTGRGRGKQAIENKEDNRVAKIATLSDDDGVLPEFVGKNDIARREQNARAEDAA